MRELAGRIEVRRIGEDFSFKIDGVEFPWQILSGVDVTVGQDRVPYVTISIPAKYVNLSDSL